MNRLTQLLAVFSITILIVAGCSGGSSPLSPPDSVASGQSGLSTSQTHLWGYYEVAIDPESKTATAVMNRQAMFTCNVVTFLNMKFSSMTFNINNIVETPDYTDIDIDVTLNHPFPGMPQYHGYDARGIFMGDGSMTLNYNPSLIFASPDYDQVLMPDPDDGFGGPDGYTRWYNLPEFSTGGMPLFQYTKGNMATPGYQQTATLSPYKYFADSLGVNDDLWSFFQEHPDLHGVFSSGASNSRNYYIRFPQAKMPLFGYAVIASWNGTNPEDHPANAPEATAVGVIDNSTVYFNTPGDFGGDLVFDLSVWDWDSAVVGGVMTDYNVIIESTVLSAPAVFSNMTPTGGGDHWYSYHLDIPVDSVSGFNGQDYWVIVEDQNHDYKNDYGITNLCGDDKLAAFFHYDLPIGTKPDIPCGPWDPAVDLPTSQTGPKNDLSAANQLPVWAERSYPPGVGLWHSHPFNDTDPGPIAFPVASVVANPPKIFVVWNATGYPRQIAALDAAQDDYGGGTIYVSPDTGHPIRRGLVCYAENSTTDRILYFDGTSGYQIKYMDYSSGVFTIPSPNTWPPGGTAVPLPSTGNRQECYRFTVDDKKQPIVFTQGIQFGTNDPDYCWFEFWSNVDKTWSGWRLPQAVMDNYFSPTPGVPDSGSAASWMDSFWNFDYEPVNGNIIIALSTNGSSANVIALDRQGNVMWSHDNLFGTMFHARAGVFIPKTPDSKCRILYVHTANAWVEGFHLYFARFDPDGDLLTVSPSDLGVSNGLHCAQVGCLVPGYEPTGTPWRYWGQTGIASSGGGSSRSYGYADLPADF